MFTNPDEVMAYVRDNDVKFIDIRFCDLPGVMQHFNVPAASVDEDFFTNGQMFDGSSIRGFQAIHESDMKLIPDVATAFIDPFRGEDAGDELLDPRPFTDEPYSRDPPDRRQGGGVPKSSGIGDTAYFGAEAGSTSSTTSASRPSRTPATTSSTRSRASGTPGARRRAATSASDCLQGWLLPGAAGRPLRRPARPNVAHAR